MRVVVLGATGSVGRAILAALDERCFVPSGVSVIALGSPASAGKQVSMGEERVLPVHSAYEHDFQSEDWVFSAVSSDIAEKLLPQAQAAGARIIDKSAAFRQTWPLVVPEVNGGRITTDKRCVASPNCVAIPLSLVLQPLHALWGVKRVVVSTYQAVSGAGKKGLDTLYAETRQVMMTAVPEVKDSPFHAQIAFNALPQIGDVQADGASEEEAKIQQEVPRIMGQAVEVQATAVRVPVFIGHGLAITADFEEGTDVRMAGQALAGAPGVHAPRKLGTLMDCAGEDSVQVGRIRKYGNNTLSLWAACDNLRKGAALNAVQIAEIMQQKKVGA